MVMQAGSQLPIPLQPEAALINSALSVSRIGVTVCECQNKSAIHCDGRKVTTNKCCDDELVVL